MIWFCHLATHDPKIEFTETLENVSILEYLFVRKILHVPAGLWPFQTACQFVLQQIGKRPIGNEIIRFINRNRRNFIIMR